MFLNVGMRARRQQIVKWLDGIRSELHFWDNWFATRGDRWPEDYAQRLDPNREIETWILQGTKSPHDAKILDVASGPLTVLGPLHDGVALNIIACDPLAPFYAQFIERYGVTRPVITQTGFAEGLATHFERNSFDVVHCRNGLDHAFDPIIGIDQMLAVTKPGGRVILQHAVDEAEREKYEGLHQWNFNRESGELIVWNKKRRVNISRRIAPYAYTTVDHSNDWIVAILTKRADTLPSLAGETVKFDLLLPALFLSIGPVR